MANTSLFVEVKQRIGNLSNDMTTQGFAEICQAYNLVEKFTAWAQLEDNVIVLARLGEVNEPDDIGMIELAHDLDFFEDVGPL